MGAFSEIAPYLTHPLVLVGFGLFVVLGFFRVVLQAQGGIIPELTKVGGLKVVLSMVRYGFIIAILLIASGFGLAFYTAKQNQEMTKQRLESAEAAKEKAEELARSALKLGQTLAADKEVSDETLKAISDAIDALARVQSPNINEALAELAEGSVSSAKQIFLEVIDASKGQVADTAAAYRHLGALSLLDNPKGALREFERAVALDPTEPESWHQLASLQMLFGDLENAKLSYAKLMQLSGSDETIEAAAYTGLGNVNFLIGEFEEASQSYKSALALLENSDQDNIARISANLGKVYQIQGKFVFAESMFEDALRIHSEIDDLKSMASHYANLGSIHLRLGNLQEAELMYRQSISLKEAFGDRIGFANLLSDLGFLKQMQGELNKANSLYQQALAIHKSQGNKNGLATVYGNLGMLEKSKGNFTQAKQYYMQSIEIDENLGVSNRIARQYANLANLNFEQGELDEAHRLFQKSLASAGDEGDLLLIATIHSFLGQVYAQKEQPRLASESWNLSLQLFESIESPQAEQVGTWLEQLQ